MLSAPETCGCYVSCHAACMHYGANTAKAGFDYSHPCMATKQSLLLQVGRSGHVCLDVLTCAWTRGMQISKRTQVTCRVASLSCAILFAGSMPDEFAFAANSKTFVGDDLDMCNASPCFAAPLRVLGASSPCDAGLRGLGISQNMPGRCTT